MANVVIDIAAEFTGNKAFKQAETGTEKLTKGVKKLALAFASVFATQKIAAFGKASTKAFIADEKAAAILTKTLNNMGLAFEDTRVKNFISDLEKTTGVLDSSLRPAMQALLTTTGSVTKSQELLKLAIDVSAGSSEDLTTVANDLSQAYIGNTKGLKRYNLGLSQAQLKATKFSNLQAVISKQFSGQNATQLDTYAGKLSLINVAYDNMQETIGKGLLDSFQLLAGDNGIAGATTAMEEFGRKTSNIILGLATLTEKITPKSGSNASGILNYLLFGVLGPLSNYLDKTGYNQSIKPKPFSTGMSISGQSSVNDPADKARTAAEKAYLKRIKELNALLAIQNNDTKAKLQLSAGEKALAELKRIFDIDGIQLQAALNNTITKEDEARVKALIALHNSDSALSLQALAALNAAKATDLLAEKFKNFMPQGPSTTFYTPQALATAAQNQAYMAEQLAPYYGNQPSPSSTFYTPKALELQNQFSASSNGMYQPSSITVNVQGSITTERDLVSVITQGIYNNQASGIPINYSTAY
jgi:hypothetical protein